MSARTPLNRAAIVAASVAVAVAVTRFMATAASPSAERAERERAVLFETIDAMERRLSEDPRNPVVGALLVGEHLDAFVLDADLSHFDRAEELSERLLETAIRKAPAYVRLAATRLGRHDFRGAYEAAGKAYALHPTDEGVLAAWFDASLAVGRYEAVESALDSLLTHHGGGLAARLREARWLDAHGEPLVAFRRFEPVCRRLEGRAVRRLRVAWCQSLLGGWLVNAGREAEAAAWFERSLVTQPGYMPGIEGLADLALARGDHETAGRLYRKIAVDAHPDLYLRLAEVAHAMGQPDRAATYERRFLGVLDEPRAEVLFAHELARFLAERPGTRDRALEVMLADLERRGSIEAHETMALVRLARGEFAEARASLEASRRWGTPSPANEALAREIDDRMDSTAVSAAGRPPAPSAVGGTRRGRERSRAGRRPPPTTARQAPG